MAGGRLEEIDRKYVAATDSGVQRELAAYRAEWEANKRDEMNREVGTAMALWLFTIDTLRDNNALCGGGDNCGEFDMT